MLRWLLAKSLQSLLSWAHGQENAPFADPGSKKSPACSHKCSKQLCGMIHPELCGHKCSKQLRVKNSWSYEVWCPGTISKGSLARRHAEFKDFEILASKTHRRFAKRFGDTCNLHQSTPFVHASSVLLLWSVFRAYNMKNWRWLTCAIHNMWDTEHASIPAIYGFSWPVRIRKAA